jgi:hypothetical protein
VRLERYQQKYQQIARLPRNYRAPLRTGQRKKCLQLLDYLAFSEQTRTTANGEVVPLAGLEPATMFPPPDFESGSRDFLIIPLLS